MDPTRAFRVDHLMAGKSPAPCIVWFRDDLRLSDHPALHAASMAGAPVICLYVFDQAREGSQTPHARPLGGAARWWLAQSLHALQTSLDAVGSSLLLRQGRTAEIVAGLAREIGSDTVSGTRLPMRRIGKLRIRSPQR
jgi:deoxyribodipyrimidine photo-lyase